MTEFYNITSLLLGIGAWSIPIFAMSLNKNSGKRFNFSFYSLALCSTSLLLQILELKHRVIINDIAAVMDTIGAISSVAMVLVIATVTLNVVGMYYCKKS